MRAAGVRAPRTSSARCSACSPCERPTPSFGRPTFIKLGQALSIRTDLIPEAYALELRQLQDAVPPFPSQQAFEVLRRQLGVRNLDEKFATLSSTPVASASIGQVYRGTLLDGRDVAVKVRRSRVLGDIALDLYHYTLTT